MHRSPAASSLRNRVGRVRNRFRARNSPVDRTSGFYGVVSTQPPIVYQCHWNFYGGVAKAMEPFYDQLHDLPVTVFVNYWWDCSASWRVRHVRRAWNVEYLARHPDHQVLHLCNSQAELDVFREAGMDAILCNQNAFVDERLFQPLAQIEPRYDAIYDAKLVPFKRHELAAEVANLALLHAQFKEPAPDSHAYDVRKAFQDAHWFNDDSVGRYGLLGPAAINEAYNECKTGLCLSAEEGAMYASVQYLLAGLPVVSTRSGGGRDTLFDPRTTIIVDDNATAVRDGVREMIARNLDPDMVRAVTLERVAEHRERVLTAVQSTYDQHGVARSAQEDWPELFFNKLSRLTLHADALAAIRGSGRT
jgi:glycosyltransferase involved in cell wall biosynthesis